MHPRLRIVLLIVFFFGLVLWHNATQQGAQHFTILAEGFLQGRLDLPRLDEVFGTDDLFFYQGRVYWVNFPFPSVVLVPFVFLFSKLGLIFYQGYLQFFLTIGVFALSYALAKKHLFTHIDSLFLAFAMCFSSNYAFVAFFTDSWFFSQPFTVIFSLLALYEWMTKKRFLLIGLYCACVFTTRPTAGLGISFFILDIFFSKKEIQQKIITFLQLMFPVIISGLLLLTYNQTRFGSVWETGYAEANIQPEYQVIMRKRHGIFKFENIPTNIYWNLLAPPDPIFENDTHHLVPPFLQANPLGMSFFIMSPLFLLIFATLKKGMHKTQILLWIGSGAILLSLWMWYSTGYFQIGARYLLDLIPFWFLLLLSAFPKPVLSFQHKTIIILGAFLNLFWLIPYLQ